MLRKWCLSCRLSNSKPDMKLQIFSVGKWSLKPALILAEEYAKRISHYLPIEIKNFKSLEICLKQKQAGDFWIFLDAKGKSFTSEDFARWIENQKMGPKKTLAFLIGPAEGFSAEAKVKADFILSLSNMTLQHELALVVLLEQIYRASTILRGEPYHK